MGRFREQRQTGERVIVERPLHIVVDWWDPDVGGEFTGRFDKVYAACLLRAMEEF
jgi:hypothetical protein